MNTHYFGELLLQSKLCRISRQEPWSWAPQGRMHVTKQSRQSRSVYVYLFISLWIIFPADGDWFEFQL